MNAHASEFLKIARSRLKFNLFLLTRLPAAFFAGLHVIEVSPAKSVIGISHRWSNQNPFKSIYFACLGMAAEMSSGILSMMHVYKREPGVSMLVLKVESEYFKKATGNIRFTCKDGEAIQLAVEETVVTHEPVVCVVKSIGINDKDEVVAIFSITWSFKAKVGKS
ncbi:DUF4442 domain-containing protein [Pollutibacter soli]|uniref:DUF4442 domain-containing protein n=1 Tax=Pollutibacter soli TaxID=3034157 RepID=UPI003013650F